MLCPGKDADDDDLQDEYGFDPEDLTDARTKSLAEDISLQLVEEEASRPLGCRLPDQPHKSWSTRSMVVCVSEQIPGSRCKVQIVLVPCASRVLVPARTLSFSGGEAVVG